MRILAGISLVMLLGVAPSANGAGLGSAAPAFSLRALDGTPVRTVAPAGKVTVLNFWATWCPPCRAETPDLVAAYHALHAAGAAFIGIDTTETAPIVKTFLAAKGVPYPTALAGFDVYNAYGIAYIPTTIVLDANGIVRARWVGAIKPAQLARFVAAARAGRTSDSVSPAQGRIDALLALPRYRFDGSPAARSAAVNAANAAIARTDALVEASDGSVDYERTQHEQGELLVAAGTALRAGAPAGNVAGLTMVARGEGDLNRWDAAARADRAALALRPGDPELVSALTHAYYRLHDYPAMIEQAERYTTLKPADGDGWSSLGLAYQRARRFGLAVPAYEKALTLLAADAARTSSQAALADVADIALDAANVYVSLGDEPGAQRAFAVANRYADRLAPRGRYAELKRNVKERTGEGLIAVALAGGGEKPVLSVLPWTGPDLPGSLASTLKYRLVVVAPPDANVTLTAHGVRPRWVASFCADGLCSPRSVSFRSPAAGVKTYEFQLVPPHDGDHPGNVAIDVGGGVAVAVPRR